jgi:hypothetical protein
VKTAFFIKQMQNMKKKILKITIILAISILAIFIFYFLDKDDSKLKLNKDRVYKLSIKLEKSIDLDKKLSLMKYNDNKLYFVSWTDNNQGKLFTLNLSSNTFDKEIDLNPKLESIIISNYFIEDGKISFVNKAENSILDFDPKSKSTEISIYKKNFSRVSKRSSNLLLSGWDENYNIYFEKYNIKTKKISKINFDDSYLKKYSNNGIVLDGVYYGNEKYTVMLPYAVNRFYVFDREFNYIKGIDLIYDPLNFKFRNKDKSDIMIDPNNLHPNLSGYLNDKGMFYILTDQSTKWNKKDQCFIDIYDIEKNEYISSIKINDFNGSQPRSILTNKDKLYILFEENLNIYKIK